MATIAKLTLFPGDDRELTLIAREARRPEVADYEIFLDGGSFPNGEEVKFVNGVEEDALKALLTEAGKILPYLEC